MHYLTQKIDVIHCDLETDIYLQTAKQNSTLRLNILMTPTSFSVQ